MEDYRLIMYALLRLSDIYLIAAEAALKKSTPNQNKADFYLNEIRKRAVSELTLKKKKKGTGHGKSSLLRCYATGINPKP